MEPVAREVVSYRTAEAKAENGDVLAKAKGAAAQLQQMLGELGIDLASVDLVRTVLGSKIVNGNTCTL